jgi:hypothetical protein
MSVKQPLRSLQLSGSLGFCLYTLHHDIFIVLMLFWCIEYHFPNSNEINLGEIVMYIPELHV